MNEQVLTDYVKALIDQRTNLELTVLQLTKELNELKSKSSQTDSGSEPGSVHPAGASS